MAACLNRGIPRPTVGEASLRGVEKSDRGVAVAFCTGAISVHGARVSFGRPKTPITESKRFFLAQKSAVMAPVFRFEQTKIASRRCSQFLSRQHHRSRCGNDSSGTKIAISQ